MSTQPNWAEMGWRPDAPQGVNPLTVIYQRMVCVTKQQEGKGRLLFHSLACELADRIPMHNLIIFGSAQTAKDHGFGACPTCAHLIREG